MYVKILVDLLLFHDFDYPVGYIIRGWGGCFGAVGRWVSVRLVRCKVRNLGRARWVLENIEKFPVLRNWNIYISVSSKQFISLYIMFAQSRPEINNNVSINRNWWLVEGIKGQKSVFFLVEILCLMLLQFVSILPPKKVVSFDVYFASIVCCVN